MAKKHIDAEKLKETINKLLQENADKACLFGAAFAGRAAEDNDIINLISSLQQEQPQVADASKMEQSEVDLEKEFQEYWYLHHYDQRLRRQVVDGHGKAVLKNVARHFYELRNRALEEAARNIYESWKGGTMDDFLRDMVELGKALNARKEE